MISSLVSESGNEAAMLADMARLTPQPAQLGAMLTDLGYQVDAIPEGLRASARSQGRDLTLAMPLYADSALSVSRRRLVGRRVPRCGTIVATLAALRALPDTGRPGNLLFLSLPMGRPAPGRSVSLEGGVVPRIWPGCFGTFELLLRVTGRPSDPAEPGKAVNAIEASIPVLLALARLKGDVASHGTPRAHTRDSPLSPRLSINAAHGGSHGTKLPLTFDIVVNRRYDPAEDPARAQEAIELAARSACRPGAEIAASMMDHLPPRPDPDQPNRTPELEALAEGWGWPQTPFRTDTPLLPQASLLGGLDRSDADPDSAAAATSLDDMGALTRSLVHLLTT